MLVLRGLPEGPRRTRRLAAHIVDFGQELEAQRMAQTGSGFSGRADVDAWLESDPNAFLLAVLFTQGIPAERAWSGPYELRSRLGHLDVGRLARMDPSEVEKALARPPALHRFKRTIPRYIVGTARHLVDEYEGQAARIWADRPTAVELTGRLSAFPGIGHKKAAMTVEILIRRFGVHVAGHEATELPYDVHVRRVMLRTGLAASDDRMEMQRAAARMWPERPSLIDLPLWLVGRTWCRPLRPRCGECRLGTACPRLTDLIVDGVGVRR